MEGAMLSIRIVTAGAVLLLLSGMTAGGAAAQTATNETPGKPLQLLQLLHIVAPPDKTKTKPHAKLLANPIAKKTAHGTVAERKQPRPPTQTATAAAPDAIWPAVNSAAPTDVAAAEPAAQPIAAPADPAPSELVVAGQTVRVAAEDDVNEIDLAANEAGTQASTAAPIGTTASAAAMSDITEPQPKSDSMTTASADAQGSDVGSASWIAQVLAALGGAVAAGSVAWFLIGSAPQRTYG
jgi:hypothetical protein